MPLVQAGQRRRCAHGTHLGQAALQRHHDRLDSRGFVFAARGDEGVLVEVGVDVLIRVATGTHAV
jgi:hypothetical protein